MALVATAPSTVWRDPNVMSATANTISSISQPLPTLGSGSLVNQNNTNGGGHNTSDHELHSPTAALRQLPPPPTHIPYHHSSLDSGNKSEDDHTDIECVVCGDKSSGKHYGQFTCEGKKNNYVGTTYFLH